MTITKSNMPIKSKDVLVRAINDNYRPELAFNANIYGRIAAKQRMNNHCQIKWPTVTPII